MDASWPNQNNGCCHPDRDIGGSHALEIQQLRVRWQRLSPSEPQRSSGIHFCFNQIHKTFWMSGGNSPSSLPPIQPCPLCPGHHSHAEAENSGPEGHGDAGSCGSLFALVIPSSRHSFIHTHTPSQTCAQGVRACSRLWIFLALGKIFFFKFVKVITIIYSTEGTAPPWAAGQGF